MQFISATAMCTGLLIAALSGPLAGPANTETVEVLLPELTGWYVSDTVREAAFSVEFDPSRVSNVQLRVKGKISPALTTCNEFNGVNVAATIPAPSGEFATGLYYVDFVAGEFGYGWSFKPFDGATWQFLDEGGGTIEFQAYPRPLPLPNGCTYMHDMYGELYVTYVSLVFELVDEQVSTETRSWGQIKALYTR